MNRRQVFVCAGCFALGTSSVSQTGHTSLGCLLTINPMEALGLDKDEFGALPDNETLENTSGDKDLDKYLGKALSRTALSFNVSPSFAFYRDQRPNAYASPDTITSGTWGSVIFGRSLFQQQFNRYKDNGFSIIGIIAHEFGHILQFKNKLIDRLQAGEPTVRRIELHADFLAGWYLGERKRNNPSISLWATGDTFHRIGDYEFNNPSHHGTPAQRVAAAEAGFSIGRRHGGVSVNDAIAEGIRYMEREVRLI